MRVKESESDRRSRPVSEREPASVRLMNTVWADRSGVHDAAWSTTAPSSRSGGHSSAHPAPAAALPTGISSGTAKTSRRLTAGPEIAAQSRCGTPASTRAPSGPALARALETVRERPRLVARLEAFCALEQREVSTASSSTGPSPARSVSDHLTSLAREAARLLGSDSVWWRRACYGPGCVLYFVQRHTRREWCSPGCGNRARVARHYRRARSSGQVSAGTAPEKRSSVQATRSATAGESSAIRPTWSRPV